MSSELDGLRSAYGEIGVGEGDANSFFSLAKKLEAENNLRVAATAYDRAYGLDPSNNEIAEARRQLLDQFAVVEHGIRFRYIPAGSFIMGSNSGEPDEQPVHPADLDEFWLSETPISWAVYCDLMGWEPPPGGFPESIPENEEKKMAGFHLHQENKIRLQYCEDATNRARNWHAHTPWVKWTSGNGKVQTAEELFGEVSRDDPRRPWEYNRKPMISISWQAAEELCTRISTGDVRYRLPTEAEWEKAARGGLINCQYPWGDEPPDEERCDFNRFDLFSILPMYRFAPNSYGLYAMSGCVWEWTADWYDALYYNDSPRYNPQGKSDGEERVLRGGSWADSAEAATVSFRMSRRARNWRSGNWGGHCSPNIGFRLCRVVT
jgi:formylglycine-generating enzyme required for sulfatase activity